jgi:hypothetical protein
VLESVVRVLATNPVEELELDVAVSADPHINPDSPSDIISIILSKVNSTCRKIRLRLVAPSRDGDAAVGEFTAFMGDTFPEGVRVDVV